MADIYNITNQTANLTTSSGIIEVANTTTGGAFVTVFFLFWYLMVFAKVNTDYDTKTAASVAGFTLAVIATIFFIMGIITQTYLIAVAAVFLISLMWALMA